MKQPVVRFVVPEGSSADLAGLCLRLGGAATTALGEGRLFVNAERVESDRVVGAGSVVEIFAARTEPGALTILLERDGLVFVDKPPGVATEPDHAGSGASVVGRLAAARGVPLSAIHAVSRLDVGVSGVVTLATTAEARRVVGELRAAGRLRRRYLALAVRAPEPTTGRWTESIGRGARGRFEVGGRDARAAATAYETLATGSPLWLDGRSEERACPALLGLDPETGRTHQLRAHAAHASAPLLGDPSYGGPRRLRLDGGRVLGLGRVFLHAHAVELTLGTERTRVVASLPSDFSDLWSSVGGDESSLHAAR